MLADELLNDMTLALAKNSHEEYLAFVHREGEFDPTRESHRGWGDLSAEYRHSNTDQVLHSIRAKVALLGAEIVAGEDAPGSISSLSEDDVEMLAKAEHSRWSKHKRDHGWSYGEVDKVDDVHKVHPQLCSWDDLSETDRDKDRIPCRRLIDDLRRFGLSIRPKK